MPRAFSLRPKGELHMNKFIFASLCLASAFAFAQPKPGQYTGVRECKGSAGDINVEATSKRTIGVATCKGEVQKKLIAEGVCNGKKKREQVVFSFTFGKDGEPDQANGSGKISCP
jgi:hypothetical protein